MFPNNAEIDFPNGKLKFKWALQEPGLNQSGQSDRFDFEPISRSQHVSGEAARFEDAVHPQRRISILHRKSGLWYGIRKHLGAEVSGVIQEALNRMSSPTCYAGKSNLGPENDDGSFGSSTLGRLTDPELNGKASLPFTLRAV